jgi:hypothetical protein
MGGAKRARSGKPRRQPSVDLNHPRLLPTRPAGFGGLTAGHDSRRSPPRQRAPPLRKPPHSCQAQVPDRTGSTVTYPRT